MNKLLKMVPLFVALALTACGGGKGGEEEQSQQQSSGQPASKSNSSTHKHSAAENAPYKYDDTNHWQECEAGDGGQVRKGSHKWVADESKASENQAATCQQAGWEYQKCSTCGATRKHDLPKSDDHRWDAGVTSDTCGDFGSILYTCQDCHTTKTESGVFIAHDWDLEHAEPVAASNGGVAYKIAECGRCHAHGYFLASADAEITFTNSQKQKLKTAPEGCAKLPSNTDSMIIAFYLPEAISGKMYQRGSMDYWYTSSNENQKKDYYSHNSGGAADKTSGVANFKIEVGQDPAALTEIALPEDKDIQYGQMLPEAVGFSGVDGTDWSQIGDCIVGNASFAAGLNYVKFTRTDSYNLAIHDFVIAVPAAPAAALA